MAFFHLNEPNDTTPSGGPDCVRFYWLISKPGALLLASLWLCTLQTATAAEYRLGVSGEMYPFFFKDGDRWRGISIEVSEHVLGNLGASVASIQSLPMLRLNKMISNGEIDLHPNWSSTPARAAIALFTKVPHVYEEHRFIALTDTRIEFDGRLSSLEGFRIAAMQGWTHGDEFDTAKGLNKIFAYSVSEQVQLLDKGRVSLAIQNPQTFNFHVRLAGLEKRDFRVLPHTVVWLHTHMGVSRHLPDAEAFRDRLDRAISEFLKTREYRQLVSSYGIQKPAKVR